MGKFLFGFITAVALTLGVGYAYLAMGLAPVATSSSPLPFERKITEIALDARVEKEALKSSPLEPTDDVLIAGVKVYRQNCALCHGFPGQEPSPIAMGESPKPPALLVGKGVSDDAPGVTYWKVANGIRLSGMPAFTGSLSRDEMWQVSLLLAESDKLPPAVQAAIHGSPKSSAAPTK